MSTRNALARIGDQVLESMGQRPGAQQQSPPAALSPVPQPRDIGRRPIAGFGQIRVADVIPDPAQPRKEFDQESLERLAASLRETGQLAPIRVRWSESEQKWMIVAGERRFRAAQHAGLETIECHFHEGELTESQVLEQQLIENLLREDLRPLEEAQAFSQLMQLNDWNGKQLAQAIRVPESKVSRALALLKLPAAIQQQVEAGAIAPRSAYELSKLTDTREQALLARRIATGNLSHAETVSAVRQRRRQRKTSTAQRGTQLTFMADAGWQIRVSASHRGNYDEVAQALRQALEEVEHRIANNVQIFS